MWKTLRAAVEDGVKEFGREALSDATFTLKDVSVPIRDSSSNIKFNTCSVMVLHILLRFSFNISNFRWRERLE